MAVVMVMAIVCMFVGLTIMPSSFIAFVWSCHSNKFPVIKGQQNPVFKCTDSLLMCFSSSLPI